MSLVFKKVTVEQSKQLSEIATEIVREHFDPIIGKAQNDYMIELFQSEQSIQSQIQKGYQYYFVCDEKIIGFMAFYPKEDHMYLSKFYLYKEYRGNGYSKEMLEFIISQTVDKNLHSIQLNVNRNNMACLVYENLGFNKIREEKNDIGGGFYMDDYVYEYRVDDVKLILLDMDGTLCDKDGYVPKEFDDALMALKNKGIMVGIASGRNANTLESGFGSKAFQNMVFITGNGTASYVDGKNVSLELLDPKQSEKILTIAEQFDNCSIALMYPTHYYIKPDNAFIEFYLDKKIILKCCDDFKKHLQGVTGISIMDNDRSSSLFLEELKHLEGDVHFTDSGFGCVDCVAPYVSKAYGIEQVLQKLNISYEQVMAIGDALNDYELLKVVGHPVVMKNGIDELRSIAKYETKYTNEENGCLKFLNETFQLGMEFNKKSF